MTLKNKRKIISALIFTVLFAIAFKKCVDRPLQITDSYVVYPDDEFGNGYYVNAYPYIFLKSVSLQIR